MSRKAHRCGSQSPWYGAAPRRAQTDRTSRELLPKTSWWVDASHGENFYTHIEAKRLIEAGGPLVSRHTESAEAAR